MPSLNQTRDGRYYIDYTDQHGDRQRPILTIEVGGRKQPVRDEDTAQRLYKAFLMAHRGKEKAPKKQSASKGPGVKNPHLRDLIAHYLEVHLVATGAEEKSIATFSTHLSSFQDFCRAHRVGRLHQISPAFIQRWMADLAQTRGPKTVGNYTHTLRACLNQALDAGLIDNPPIPKWTTPKVPDTEQRTYTHSALQAILKTAEDRDPPFAHILRFLAATGNRPSDAVSLKVHQVDLVQLNISRIGVKAKRLMQYPINALAAQAIQDALRGRKVTSESTIFLWSKDERKPWTNKMLLGRLKTISRRAGVPYATLKMFRTTFGTIHANELGTPLPHLAILMNHTDITTTMKYVKPGDPRPHANRFADWLQPP